MKIGFFTSIEGWGGSETYLLSLMKGVREAGHMPVLFGIEGTRLYREAQDAGLECVAWKVLSLQSEDGRRKTEDGGAEEGQTSWVTKWKRLFLKWMPAGVKLLAGNLREVMLLRRLFLLHPVDVMHVNLSGYEVAGLACRLNGVPSIGWHCIMPSHLPRSIRKWLYWWTGRMYTFMGGPSRTCVDEWREWCEIEPGKCRAVWNGIPLEKYLAISLRQRRGDKPFIALAVGRLHPMKGFDVLIKACKSLNDPRLKLIIAGEGPAESDLRHLAGTPPVVQVEFAGHCEDMAILYQAVNCMILPSVSHESFGLVLAEAMASGLPLITSDYGPLPEINIANRTGLVVPAGDPNALATAIRTLMDDPLLGVELGITGRKRAQECFSEKRMIDSMVNLYKDVMGSH